MRKNLDVFNMFSSIGSVGRRFAFLHRVLRGEFPCFNGTIKALRLPAVGIRASRPNEIWHIDTSVVRFLNTLDTVRSVEKLVAFYVQEHNTRLPHSAFQGQTPDEMHFGTGGSVPAELAAARQKAREARADANRKRTCSACELVTVSLN